MLKVEILTLFPELIQGFTTASLIGKAIKKQLLDIRLTQIRDFASAPHFSVDDTPYGGGAGMVMRPEPLALAIEDAKSRLPNAQVVLLAANGKTFNQQLAKQYSSWPELILICGRYEGVDQRIIELFVDHEISIGDYVLMGGEVPAMVVIEASARLIPGVIGNSESLLVESFESQECLLESPQYTKPAEFRGLGVPEVLLSGNHAAISNWRKQASQKLTDSRRSK